MANEPDAPEATDTPTEGPATGAPAPSGPPSIRRPLLIAAAVLIVVFAGLGFALVRGSSTPTNLTYVVPAGTGARIDAGDEVAIIPQHLDLRAGDSVTVVNQDSRTHEVGPFSVRAGETINYVFSKPATYIGTCTVHTGGEVTITVT